ncbi:MAG: CDP-alcohol phosphatidyltransferase family protein [Planctomycetota bacterium]|jgi:phosphatidylglycerophosphate synthase
MANYEPTSRRPIAGGFRRASHFAVGLCLRWKIPPDAISYASIVASAAAGCCFWQAGSLPWLLAPAVLLSFVRLWCNMLDGMIALAGGTASRRGEILNDLPDRLSDVLIFVGVAHSGLCHPLGGYWTAIFALLVAYVGTLGQAVGAEREFSGVMAKPWRMLALSIGAAITLALLLSPEGRIRYGGLTVLDWTHAAIVAGCVQTIAVRLVRILRSLREKEPGPSSHNPASEP